MNRQLLQSVFRSWDQQGRYVFSKHELAKLFLDDSPKTLAVSLNRHTNDGFVQRACRGIYINPLANSFGRFTLETIASILRRGHYNYISLESALSEYGAISQIPIDRLTIMTTGRSGTYETPYGVIEFTHTQRSVENVLKNTLTVSENPLRIATKEAAWRDLKRVGRNTHLVDTNEVKDG